MSQIPQAEATEHYGIGVIVGEAPSTKISIIDEFDYETYNRFESALARALAPTDRFNIMLVEKNFQTYLNIQKFVGRILVLGRKFGQPDRKALGQSVMSQIVNWLTSFRLFLDHAETDLKRRYGADSDQFRQFYDRTALAFDGDVGTGSFPNFEITCSTVEARFRPSRWGRSLWERDCQRSRGPRSGSIEINYWKRSIGAA
jgi:hypothetical protein